MDKTLRNVIIFAGLILLIAAVFTVMTLSNRNSSNGSTTQTNNNLGGNNNANTQTNTAATGEVQNVQLSVSGGTYVLTPSVLKLNVPVRMVADLSTVRGCSRDVVISAFGVRKYVKDGDNVITFTPTKTGTINIACSMNMYRGTFTVVDDTSASTNLKAVSPVESSQTTPTTTTTLASTPSGGCTMGANGGGCGCGATTGGCGCGG